MTEKTYFPSRDGIKLCGIWTIPDKTTDKAIILAHGITVDKEEDGLFTSLGESLGKNGFAVLRFDFRGHGESGGKPIDMTIKGERADLDAAIEEAEVKGYASIGLLGASFGGGVSTLYTVSHQHKLRCLCLWNPCLNYDHCFLNPSLPWIRARKAHMKKDLEDQGWTTLGSREFVLGKQLFDEMARLFPYQELKRITIPLMIIHGDKDIYVPLADSQESIRGMKNGELVIIEGGEHGFHEPAEHTLQASNETLRFFKKYL